MNLNLPEKLYYSIGEIAEAFDVKTSLLRFWEKEFELLKPKKNLKGTRRYSRVDIENIGLIYSLVKKRGFTIDGAKEKIKYDSDKINVLKKLEKLKSTLEDIRKELKLFFSKVYCYWNSFKIIKISNFIFNKSLIRILNIFW